MSTCAMREELFDLIRRDLLGPAGGEREIVTEQSVRNRYLLGRLAPRKEIEVEEEPLEELADGSEDNAEEAIVEPSTPARRGVAPSTFGLSFCLDLALAGVQPIFASGMKQSAPSETAWAILLHQLVKFATGNCSIRAWRRRFRLIRRLPLKSIVSARGEPQRSGA